MPLFLNNRNQKLKELMDLPDCDPVKLQNTYRQFKWINRFLSQWTRIYKNEIRPILLREGGAASLLDIGFGGGDIPILLDRLARKDGFDLKILAIEADQRSFEFARSLDTSQNIQFKKISSTELVEQKEKFDFVISNHLIHHLDENSLKNLCRETELLSTKKVIFNDIRRSYPSYFLFFIFSKIFFWNSFVSHDGLISIKRSYTEKELVQTAPKNWTVSRLFPFRLVISYEQ